MASPGSEAGDRPGDVAGRLAGLLGLATGSPAARWLPCAGAHHPWVRAGPEVRCSCGARAPTAGSPGDAWEGAVGRGYAPPPWLASPLLHASTCPACLGAKTTGPGFGCRACRAAAGPHSRGVALGTAPATFGSVLGAAARPRWVAAAEGAARELLARLADWGVTATAVALWCPDDDVRAGVGLRPRMAPWSPALLETRAGDPVLPTVGWPDELGSFGRATFCEAWASKKSSRWDSPVLPDPYRPLLDLARLGYRPWLIDAEALVIVER